MHPVLQGWPGPGWSHSLVKEADKASQEGQALSSCRVLWPGVGRGDRGPAGWGVWRGEESLTGRRWV